MCCFAFLLFCFSAFLLFCLSAFLPFCLSALLLCCFVALPFSRLREKVPEGRMRALPARCQRRPHPCPSPAGGRGRITPGRSDRLLFCFSAFLLCCFAALPFSRLRDWVPSGQKVPEGRMRVLLARCQKPPHPCPSPASGRGRTCSAALLLSLPCYLSPRREEGSQPERPIGCSALLAPAEPDALGAGSVHLHHVRASIGTKAWSSGPV